MLLKKVFPFYVLFVIVIPGLTAHTSVFSPLPISIYTIIDVLIGVYSAAAIIYIFLYKRQFRKKLFLFLSFLLALVIIPQTILSLQNNLDNKSEIYRFCCMFITLFIIPMCLDFEKKDFFITTALLCAYGVICCGYAVIKKPEILAVAKYADGDMSSKVTSFFEHRNRFAAYLSLWIILTVTAFYNSKRKVWLLLLLVFVPFLFMTASRASVLMTAVFIFIRTILFSGDKKKSMYYLLDLFLIFGILFFIPPARKLFTSFIGFDRGLSSRSDIWRESFNYFLSGNLLAGHGFGVSMESILTEKLRMNVSTHNAYLYILNSGGILLLLFYLITVVFLLKSAKNKLQYLVPFLAAMSTYGMFELACTPFDFWHLSNFFTFCFSAAGMMISSQTEQKTA